MYVYHIDVTSIIIRGVTLALTLTFIMLIEDKVIGQL